MTPGLRYQLRDLPSFVNARIVQNQHRSLRKLWKPLLGEETLEVNTLHSSKLMRSTDHSLAVEGSDDGEVFPALGGDFLYQLLSFLSPAVQDRQSERDPHLVEKDKVIRVERLYLLPEFLALCRISFQRDSGFFLKTKAIFPRTRVMVGTETLTPVSSSQAWTRLCAVQSVRERTISSRRGHCPGAILGFLPVLNPGFRGIP